MSAQLPESVSLGLGPSLKVVRVSIRTMRKAAKCERQDGTPDGLWDGDGERILVLRNLTWQRSLEVYFHELTHALADVSYWVRHA